MKCFLRLKTKTSKKEENKNGKIMDTIVNLCKARGYIYPGSEIYGGLSNTWDYGASRSRTKK